MKQFKSKPIKILFRCVEKEYTYKEWVVLIITITAILILI